MKKILFAALASAALLAAAPATALARHDQRRHQMRVIHKHFGGNDTAAGENQNAGTVMAFSGGVLTIRLTNGSTARGRVSNATELECEMAEPQVVRAEDRGSGDGDSGDRGGDNGTRDENEQNEVEDQNGVEAEHMCTTAALRPNVVVHEAALDVSRAGSIWKKVELITP